MFPSKVSLQADSRAGDGGNQGGAVTIPTKDKFA